MAAASAPLVARSAAVGPSARPLPDRARPGRGETGTGADATTAADADTAGPPVMLTAAGSPTPIGVGVDDVTFAWQLADGRRGAGQLSYRILVTGPPLPGPGAGAGPVAWDSGRVDSADQACVAYGGEPLAPDSVYRWTVQTWDADGVAGPVSAPAVFETGLRDVDWKASWITRPVTPTPSPSGPDQYTYARRSFALDDASVLRARCYVSGDQQYELSVNGVRAGKGQAYSYPDHMYYETLDVTGLVHAGTENVIGVLYHWDGATKGHPAGLPAVIVQVSVAQADGSTALVGTDGSWRVLPGAWAPGTQRDLEGDVVDFTENIVGPAIPLGWDSPGFDDAGWAPATVVGPAGVAPWSHLVSVRTRVVESAVPAVAVTTLPGGSVVADFGKVYAAVPTVTFRHGTPGRTVHMHAGYLLDEPSGRVSTAHGTQHTDMSYSYVQRGGTEQFHPFDYLGFRYLQVDDPGEPLAPSDLVALTRHAAVPDENAGSFTSSDGRVDAVFELGRHSALFTAQEQYIDTPTREKGPWLWDGCNESQTAMAAFGEQNLTRKSLLEFAESQGRYWPRSGALNKIYPTGLGALDINEFTEIYAEWVWQYWLHWGDLDLLRTLYPVLVGVAQYVADSVSRSTGLVTNLPATSLYYLYPVVTRINVLGVNVFRIVADAAGVVGRPRREVALQRRRQAALTRAINAKLTRFDGVYFDGRGVSSTSQDANACALAYGVVPPDRQEAVAAHVAAAGMQSEPARAGEVLRGLGLAGRDGDILRVIVDKKGNGWSNILARGGTFTWEVWQPSDADGDSMSHGWGSNVLVEIQRFLLGVLSTGPGFSTFDVAPPRSVLDWARGTVPTPRGPVTLHWSRPSAGDGGFALDLVVPPNASATVHLPASHVGDVTETGHALHAAAGVHVVGVQGPDVVVRVGAGTYEFRCASPRH